MRIFLDAGHRNNVNDYGATGNGYKESSINLEIVKRLRERLLQYNVKVECNRYSEDETISLEQRVKKAKDFQADLYISIHCNSFSDPTSNGIEVLYQDDSMKNLSKDLTDLLSKRTGFRNRKEKKRTDLYVLNNFKKAFLIETGFISNPTESRKIASTEYQDKIVQAIIDILITYGYINQADNDYLKAIDFLHNKKIISDKQLWIEQNFKSNHVRSLIIKMFNTFK